jgi:hypothetical protein
MGDLRTLFISQSYTSLIHTSNDGAVPTGSYIELQDGSGNGLGIEVNRNGNFNIQGEVSASSVNGIGNVTAYSASVDARLRAGGGGSGSDITSLNEFTASQLTINDGYNTFTQSYYVDSASFDTRIDNIVTGTGFVTTGSFNSYTSSTDNRLDSIETTTASLQSQIDNIDTGSLLETASVNLNTITFTKADTTTFDITIDTGSGGGGTVDTGSLLTTASVSDATITFTKGDSSTFDITVDNVVSASRATLADNAIEIFVNAQNTSGFDIPKGTAVHSTGVTGDKINITTASYDDPTLMPAIGITQTAISNNAVGEVILTGRIQGLNTSNLTAGSTVYVNGDGSLTSTKPTGSALIQNIGTCVKSNATEGEVLVLGSGRSNDLPNITEGYLWVGDGDGVPVAISTGSFVRESETGSFARTDIANNFTGSQTFDLPFDFETKPNGDSNSVFKVDNFQNLIQLSLVSADTFSNREIRFYPSASYAPGYPQNSELGFTIREDGAFTYDNAMGITNSSNGKLLQFRIEDDGDGDNFRIYFNNSLIQEVTYENDFKIYPNINTVGGIDTNAKCNFLGGAEVLGGFTASLSEGNVFVGGSGGTSYELPSSSLLSNSAILNGNNTFSGSQTITGPVKGNVEVITIASSTASIDCSLGNFFTVTLPTGETHFTATNITAGQTVSVKVATQNNTTASIDSGTIKMLGSSGYTTTQTTTDDILTFVSYDGSFLYGVVGRDFG